MALRVGWRRGLTETGSLASESGEVGGAIKLFQEVFRAALPTSDYMTDDVIRAKEQATYRLGEIYQSKGKLDEIVSLIKEILPLFREFPKTKLGKIIRTLFELSLKIQGKVLALGWNWTVRM